MNMAQTEIITPGPLLDKRGELLRPGFSRTMVQSYRREDVRVSPLRLKEWDYYLVSNGRYALALTVADNGYMGLDSVSFLCLEEGWEITKSPMQIMTLGKKRMPPDSREGDVYSAGKDYFLSFAHQGERRILSAEMHGFGVMEDITATVELEAAPPESMVIATPFDKSGHFYYNQKINCLRAKGTVVCGGRTWEFDSADSFAVLDWGRGVWTYENTWYWSSASYTVDGVPFGWNLGYGFGDTSAATENVLVYDGRVHKLAAVTFYIPGNASGHPRFTEPWRFYSSDNRFEADFRPVLDRQSCTDFKALKSDQHQVFGFFTGRAVLDDGRIVPFRELPGFAEKVYNKW